MLKMRKYRKSKPGRIGERNIEEDDDAKQETLKRTLMLKKVIKRRATFAQDSDFFCDSWVLPPTMTIRKI